jgi:hypothetical protein
MYRMTLEIFVRHLAAFVERRRAQGLESVARPMCAREFTKFGLSAAAR